MLKYQVRSNKSLRQNASTSAQSSLDHRPSSSSSSTSSFTRSVPHETIKIRDRSNSLSSLSSVDSSDSSEWGTLRIYTGNIKEDTDYKTLKVSTSHTSKNVIETVLNKFRIISKDPNLYELIMEVRTRINDEQVYSLLALPHEARPLELQRCHPAQMSRFMITVSADGVLIRIYDYKISSQSNYKSLLISPRTTCYEAIVMLLAMNRYIGPPTDYRLCISGSNQDLAMNDTLADLYMALDQDQKLLIRSVS